MADPRPLWEVMEESTGTVAEWGCVIRAVRDWLVPEERTLDPVWFGTVVEHESNWRQGLRALLTAEADRAQRQPVPPEPVEVQELVGLIRQIALAWEPDARLLGNMTAEQAARAADLLERQAASAPMASDTRYEFSVIDADCTEQAGGSAPTYAQALSEGQHYLAQYQQDGPHALEVRRVEVLHPDALPLLPEGAQVIEPAKHTILVPVPVPVAVSERLPGPGDLGPDGAIWFRKIDRLGETHWLPAHDMPLPGEVEG